MKDMTKTKRKVKKEKGLNPPSHKTKVNKKFFRLITNKTK